MTMQEIPLAAYPLEIGLFLLIAVVLGMEILLPPGKRGIVGACSTLGLGLLLGLSVLFTPDGRHGPDGYALFFQRLFLLVAVFVSVMTQDFQDRLRRGAGEFHALLLFATTGLLFVSRAQDFLTLFVSIELLTVSLFIMAAYLEGDGRSTEAGMKYVILGALASAFLLYGVAFIYGYTGSLRFEEVARVVGAPGGAGPGVILGLALVLAGLAFKVAAVPFHFWVPDVYEGAPTPVTAFLTVASKGAGLAALARILGTVMDPISEGWAPVIGLLAAATLLYGNLGAIPQTNIKRLLAYSSIGQAGFVLIGLAAASEAGTQAILFYLLAYAFPAMGFPAMGAFLAIVAFSRASGSDELRDYHGLWRRSPLLAIAIAVSFLSLAGFPPLAGFFGKFLLLTALIRSPGMLWLAVLAGANVIIALYYYLGVIRRVLVHSPVAEGPVTVSLSTKVAIAVALLGTVILGVYQGPFVAQAGVAARALFLR
jgi:NADH-quinone oxidoreductase subunit N